MRRTAIGGGQYTPSMKSARNIDELIYQYENAPRYSAPMQLASIRDIEVRSSRPWQSNYSGAPSLSSLTDSEFYSDSDVSPQIAHSTQHSHSPIYDRSNAVEDKVIYNLSMVGRFLEMLQRLPLPRMSLTATGICFLIAIFISPRPCAQSIIFPAFRLTFGTLYPAYASYKAVRTKNVKEYVKWMMYWIVYAFFNCTETFTDIFLSWFPFYYEVKVIIVLWLLSPATKGSSTLYRKFVHPMLTRREQEIDEYLNQAKERGYSAVLQLGSKGVNYATNVIMQTALKGGGNLVQTIRRSYSLSDLSEPDIHRTQDEIDEITRPQQRILRARNPVARSTSGSRHSTGMYFSEVDVASKNPSDFTNYNIRSSEDISSGYSSAEPISAGLSRTSSMTNATRARFKAKKAEAENDVQYRQNQPISRIPPDEMCTEWRDKSFFESEQYFQNHHLPGNGAMPLNGPRYDLSNHFTDDFKNYLAPSGVDRRSYSEEEKLQFTNWLEDKLHAAQQTEEEDTNELLESKENILNVELSNKEQNITKADPKKLEDTESESDDEFLDAIPEEFAESKLEPVVHCKMRNEISFTEGQQIETKINHDQSNTMPTTSSMGPKALKESLEEIQNSFRTAIHSPLKVTTAGYDLEKYVNPQTSEGVLRKSPSHSKGKAPPPPIQTPDNILMPSSSASNSRSSSPMPEKAINKKPGLLKTYLPSIFRSEPKTQAKSISQPCEASCSSISNEYPIETEI